MFPDGNWAAGLGEWVVRPRPRAADAAESRLRGRTCCGSRARQRPKLLGQGFCSARTGHPPEALEFSSKWMGESVQDRGFRLTQVSGARVPGTHHVVEAAQ